jgi:HEPN domain-containing protein
MDKDDLVTETPFELFDKAESDVLIIDSHIKNKNIPEEWKYDSICFHATQAVEKFIKGFIIDNSQNIKKSHNLIYLWNEAIKIDKIFKDVKDDCELLNNYTAWVRYNFHSAIEQHEFIAVIKSLKNVYSFGPIQEIRDKFSKQKGYRILPNMETLWN